MTETRRTYCKPMLSVERFAANEYVAACWGVACVVANANTYEQTNNTQVWKDDGNNGHRSANCGNAKNQVIYDDNNDNVPDRMIEEGTDGLGNLTCHIYSDAAYSTSKNIADVKVGDYIYWRTYIDDNPQKKCWSHQGKVVAEYPNRPLHS